MGRDYENIKAESQRTRDISHDFPPIDTINWDRRNACKDDLKLFLETYFPQAFTLGWSPDHLRIIAKLQTVITEGGLNAIALPRSSGKTTICERAAIWAIVTGKHRFTCLIGSTQKAAEQLLSHIKTELQFNPLLLKDYPTACYPIVKLENEPRRCVGQLYDGKNTLIIWSSYRLQMPQIDRADSTCSGSIITTCGLTGHIRGQLVVLPNGEAIRPSLILLDDPQTEGSASSKSQTKRRLDILHSDVLGLGGLKQISALCTCTVIYKEDLSDQILDRGKYPQWQGERTKLLYEFPKNIKLWDEYQMLRNEAFRNDKPITEATEYYRKNQEAMDEGAIPAWKERFNADEISAIQNCMNLFFRNEQSFFSEYQNDPQYTSGEQQDLPSTTEIIEKINGLRKNLVPINTKAITCFIDVQETLLYYCVVAWESNYSGSIIDYGSYPDQKRIYFTLQQAKKTLQTELPKAGLEGQIYFGLDQLVTLLTSKDRYKDEGGTERSIDKILIDANWGRSTGTIYKFCKEHKHRSILMPSHGRFIGATRKPFSEYSQVHGDINGDYWRIPKPNKGKVRHILIDTNHYKSFLFGALKSAKGDPGSLTLWGDKPDLHKMFADQLRAENCIKVMANGRVVDEWKSNPSQPDNHFLDCLTGCFAAASLFGIKSELKKIPVKNSDKNTKIIERKKKSVSYITL